MAGKCRVAAIHIPPPVDGARALEWMPYDQSTRMRCHEATCTACSNPLYEWGPCGGVYRIRRTARIEGEGYVIHMTPAVRRRIAIEWWESLLKGEAL